MVHFYNFKVGNPEQVLPKLPTAYVPKKIEGKKKGFSECEKVRAFRSQRSATEIHRRVGICGGPV